MYISLPKCPHGQSPLGAAVHIAVDKYMIKHDCVRKSEIMGHYLKAQMQRIMKAHPTMDDVKRSWLNGGC